MIFDLCLCLGWTKEETVESLLKKAGVRSQMTQALKDSIKLIRYRSEKVEMDFEVSLLFCLCVSLRTCTPIFCFNHFNLFIL